MVETKRYSWLLILVDEAGKGTEIYSASTLADMCEEIPDVLRSLERAPDSTLNARLSRKAAQAIKSVTGWKMPQLAWSRDRQATGRERAGRA